MKIKDFMRKNPPTVRLEDCMADVVRILIQDRVDSVQVLNQCDELKGIISRSHIFKLLAKGVSQDVLAKDIMKEDLITIHPDDSVENLIKWEVSSLPVVKHGKLVGLISLIDTIQAYYASALEYQRELKAVIYAAYNGIISVDPNLIIRIINPAAEKFLHCKKSEVVGKQINEIFEQRFFSEVISTGNPVIHKKVEWKDKTYIVTCTGIKNQNNKIIGAVAIFQDSTELEELYQELLHTKELTDELNAIIESSYDGILVTDPQGVITKANSSLKTILGNEEIDLVGYNLNELNAFFQEDCLDKSKNEKSEMTASCSLRTGGKLLITTNPILKKDGSLSGAVANVRDISKLKILEEKISSLNELYQLEVVKSGILSKYVFVSAKSRALVDMALKISKVDSTVLLTGESGVGKEVIADILYTNSKRAEKPFIKINCGAIPENLLESELFGYLPGAFTGASKEGKRGLFESANEGILFLDEVGELPMHLQVKLLRVIQKQEVIRIGGVTPIKIDVRIIAATNRNLYEMVEKGTFRQDLYYRLNVVPIHIPSLRDRREDIPELSNYYLNKFNHKYNLNKKFSKNAINEIFYYDWPGNIRELENIIERTIVTATEDIIDKIDLPIRIERNTIDKQETVSELRVSYKEMVADYEKQILLLALKKYGTTRKAGKALGIDQSTIVKKMAKFGIAKPKKE